MRRRYHRAPPTTSERGMRDAEPQPRAPASQAPAMSLQLSFRQHDGADHGDEQQHRRNLERNEIARVEEPAHLLRVAGDRNLRLSDRWNRAHGTVDGDR